MKSKQRHIANDMFFHRIDEMPMNFTDREWAKSRLRLGDCIINGFCDLLVAIRLHVRHLRAGRPIEVHSGVPRLSADKSTFLKAR